MLAIFNKTFISSKSCQTCWWSKISRLLKIMERRQGCDIWCYDTNVEEWRNSTKIIHFNGSLWLWIHNELKGSPGYEGGYQLQIFKIKIKFSALSSCALMIRKWASLRDVSRGRQGPGQLAALTALSASQAALDTMWLAPPNRPDSYIPRSKPWCDQPSGALSGVFLKIKWKVKYM